MKEPGRAPVYMALYPELAKIARSHGYALAIHGSCNRDLDLVCVPWADTVSHPQMVVDEIIRTFDIRQIGTPFRMKYQRLCYTISIGHGECAIDLSFVGLPVEWLAGVKVDDRAVGSYVISKGVSHFRLFNAG